MCLEIFYKSSLPVRALLPAWITWRACWLSVKITSPSRLCYTGDSVCSYAYSRAKVTTAISALSTPQVDVHPIDSCLTTRVSVPAFRTTAIAASRLETEASVNSPRSYVLASLIAWSFSLITAR
jgi:hypothetical protein